VTGTGSHLEGAEGTLTGTGTVDLNASTVTAALHGTINKKAHHSCRKGCEASAALLPRVVTSIWQDDQRQRFELAVFGGCLSRFFISQGHPCLGP
jgi:hypothetical protein